MPRRKTVVYMCLCLTTLFYIERNSVGVLIPFMAQEDGMSMTEKGRILGAFFAGYVTNQVRVWRHVPADGSSFSFRFQGQSWVKFLGATSCCRFRSQHQASRSCLCHLCRAQMAFAFVLLFLVAVKARWCPVAILCSVVGYRQTRGQKL